MISMKQCFRLVAIFGIGNVAFFIVMSLHIPSVDFPNSLLERPMPSIRKETSNHGSKDSTSKRKEDLDIEDLSSNYTNHRQTPTGTKQGYLVGRTHLENKDEAVRLSPDNKAAIEGIQISNDMLVAVGGYIDNYRGISRSIQFFNITSQTWLDDVVELPANVAETHQGLAFDKGSNMIYIISGQKGPGCMQATTFSTRLNLDTKTFEALPALPFPRYAPSVAVVADQSNPFIKHIHVFGGATESRNMSATDHWRLQINELTHDEVLEWEALEAVPDAGIHGTSFVCERGYIYYTGFCSMDSSILDTPSMAECYKHATDDATMLQHGSDAGFTFRYPSAFVKSKRSKFVGSRHWERMSDMPFPVCHAGSVVYSGRAYLVGGATAAWKTGQQSAPSFLSVTQTYDSSQDIWHATSFMATKRTKLFNSMAWIDHQGRMLYSLHPGNSLVRAELVSDEQNQILERSGVNKNSDTFRASFVKSSRGLSIKAFKNCLMSRRDLSLKADKEKLRLRTVFDDGFDEIRGTWNKRNYHLQYPDIVAFPNSARHVSVIVQCAKRTRYRVCARNGKHIYDGSTCTRGIVVDVSNLNSALIQNEESGTFKLGAGLTLGKVAIELEKFGFTLPMGTCTTVGVTGLTLNGGQGPLSRLFGLTSDHLQAVELVDSDGNQIFATETNEFADYLWLARGSGAAIQHYPGIITSLTFSGLPTIPSRNETIWSRIQINFEPTARNAVDLLLAWQDFHIDDANNSDPLFNRVTAEPWLFMHYKKKRKVFRPGLFLIVHMFGDNQVHEEFIERYLPIFQNMAKGGTTRSIERLDAISFHRAVGGVKSDSELAGGNFGHDLNKVWKGYSAVATSGVSSEAFQVLAESIFESRPICRRYAELKPLGGAIRRRHTKTDTAFWHRDAIWWVLSNHFYEENELQQSETTLSAMNNPKQQQQQQTNVTNILIQSITNHENFIHHMNDSFGGKYAGYIDTGKSMIEDLEMYYGENSKRIRSIKHQRDPHNMFRHYLPNSANWTVF